MKKLLIGLAVLGIFLGGCQKREEAKPAQQENRPAAQAMSPAGTDNTMIEKIYEGVLPCADCSGIQTRLKFNRKPGDSTANTFELTRIYMGKEPDNVTTIRGTYMIQQGMDGDSTATVFVLNSENPKDEPIYFAVLGNDAATMHQLDQNMKKMESDRNTTLKLIN